MDGLNAEQNNPVPSEHCQHFWDQVDGVPAHVPVGTQGFCLMLLLCRSIHHKRTQFERQRNLMGN
ncbi:hypothetical protein C8Q75DRAFT_774020 [Abortiporus biennis]|nr:hypothetical protein C8Q75DRAFT_774020 [Abortiporus biennis]